MSQPKSSSKNASQFVQSTGPDVCKTPMGSSMVPVAYSSIAFFDKSVRTVNSVRYQGEVEFNVNSRISKSMGTEPGIGKGIKDSGHLGPAKITKASSSVNSDGAASVRDGDAALINMSKL